MIPCPRCHRPIPESAVRCRHCRHAIHPPPFKPPVFVSKTLQGRRFLPRFAEEPEIRWGWLEVLLFLPLFLAGSWWLQQQGTGMAWVDWLRRNFFIFTREPLLQMYVYIFTETFLLKLGSVLLLVFYLRSRGSPIAKPLALSGPVQNRSNRFLAGFFFLCVLVAWWEGIDPLSPDLPTPLFFQESALLGNLLAVFSLVVVAPDTEEIIFRGFLFPVLRKSLGPWVGVLITSVLFALAHAPQMHGAYDHLWVIFVVGLLLSWQRAVTGSTKYTIYLHALYNASLTLGGFLRFCFYGF